jgi:DNA-binding transcriptional MerR regulator
MERARSKMAARPRKRKASVDITAKVAEQTLKIGEAARLLGVEAYVLRFWETQFPFLRPRHAPSKHRFYGHNEIETLKLIKRLLHTQGYTIAGAKKHIREVGLDRLRGNTASADAASIQPALHAGDGRAINGSVQRELAQIRDDLRSLHRLLESSD